MKNLLSFILLLLATGVAAQDVNEILIKPKIEEITVFLNSAEIRLEHKLDLIPGENKIIVAGLSPSMDPNSIQVTIKNVEILSVTSSLNYINKDELTPQLQNLVKMKDTLENDKSLIKDKVDAYLAKKEVLVQNRYIGSQQSGVSIAGLQKAMDFHQQNTLQINQVMTTLNNQLNEIDNKMVSLQNQLNVLNYSENQKRMEITITLNANQKQQSGLLLRYLVHKTGWAPGYDFIASDITKPIELKYRAKVYNNTGINWNDVKLTLSTADPTLVSEKPNMTAWVLDYNSDYQDEYIEEKSVGKPIGIVLDKNVTYINRTIDKLGMEFPITKPYTIPADAKPYLVDIKSINLQCEFSYFAIPKIDRDAFLVANITDWQKLKLIDGSANVYFGDSYVGKSQIDTRSIEDTLPVSIGRDKQVLITRTLKEDYGSKKLIGITRKKQFTYEIVVKNNRNAPVRIEINDQVPISRQSDIIVEVEEISGASLDENNGKVTWKPLLEPGEAKVYKLSYSIKYPKNKQVKTTDRITIPCVDF